MMQALLHPTAPIPRAPRNAAREWTGVSCRRQSERRHRPRRSQPGSPRPGWNARSCAIRRRTRQFLIEHERMGEHRRPHLRGPLLASMKRSGLRRDIVRQPRMVHSYSPKIAGTLLITIQRGNVSDLNAIVDLAISLGIDLISFSLAAFVPGTYANSQQRVSKQRRRLALSMEDVDQVERAFTAVDFET